MEKKNGYEELANIFRQCADIADELTQNEDADKEEELIIRLALKMMKIQELA